MLEAGILDPTKVTRLALQNAASVAGLLLTTEVMIAEAPKDDDHAHGGCRPVAWAAWAAWTCKERQRSLLPDARRLAREDRKPPAGNCRGFFFARCRLSAEPPCQCRNRLSQSRHAVRPDVGAAEGVGPLAHTRPSLSDTDCAHAHAGTSPPSDRFEPYLCRTIACDRQCISHHARDRAKKRLQDERWNPPGASGRLHGSQSHLPGLHQPGAHAGPRRRTSAA